MADALVREPVGQEERNAEMRYVFDLDVDDAVSEFVHGVADLAEAENLANVQKQHDICLGARGAYSKFRKVWLANDNCYDPVVTTNITEALETATKLLTFQASKAKPDSMTKQYADSVAEKLKWLRSLLAKTPKVSEPIKA